MIFQFIICFFVFIFDTNNKEIKKELILILNLKSVPVNILTPLKLEVFKRTEILEMKYGVLGLMNGIIISNMIFKMYHWIQKIV
jgi:hypothetical protein